MYQDKSKRPAGAGTEEFELRDQVISIRRVTKVVKGGKNLSFSALAAVGNAVSYTHLTLPTIYSV